MTAVAAKPLEQAISEFRAFYVHLANAKRQAAELAVLDPEGEQAHADLSGVHPVAHQIFETLYRVLAENGYGQRRERPVDGTDLELGYVMSALADEALLHLVDHPERLNWNPMLLEKHFYGTHVAGERVLLAAEKLAAGESPGRVDLAYVILQALLLGFRGRYFGCDDRGALDLLRRRLYERVFNRHYVPAVQWQLFFDDAGAYTFQDEKQVDLPRLRPWLFGIIGLVIAYLIVSHVIWHAGVDDVLERAERIDEVRNVFER